MPYPFVSTRKVVVKVVLEVTLLTRGASGSEATLSAGCMAQGISQQTIS